MSSVEIKDRFQFIEDARRFALLRPGSEVIRKDGDQFRVEGLDSTLWSSDKVESFFKQDSVKLTEKLLPFPRKRDLFFKQEIAKLVKNTPIPAVEVVFDDQEDGDKTNDKRFTIKSDGTLEEAKFALSVDSGMLLSIEMKAIATLRKAIEKQDVNLLLDLSPDQIRLLKNHPQLTASERAYVEAQFYTEQSIKSRQIFEKFIGGAASLRSAGMEDYNKLMIRLNDSNHLDHFDQLYTIAKDPESFQSSVAQDSTRLIDLAATLRQLPGFRRYPAALPANASKQKLFEDALRTLDHYKFKVRIQHGMQFNRDGLASYGTELSYRMGGSVLSLGLSGRDYDFTNFGQQGMDYQDHAGDARQRMSLGFASGSLDAKLNVVRDQQGKLHLERPESQFANQYIARKQGDVLDWGKNWAKKNPVWAGTIVAGGLAGVYLYSKEKPDQLIPLEFGNTTTLYETEFIRIKAAGTPVLTLKNGALDLGVKELGLGLSGNKDDHFYDANVRQRFDNTTIRSGEIISTATEVNLRYGFDNNSFTLDENYNYHDSNLNSRLGYRKDIVLGPGFRTYGQAYLQLQHGNEYQTAGAVVGGSKEFGDTQTFSVGVNVGYDHQGGVTGGFGIVKEF